MGQDNSCGICGKHYQCCKHYVKDHAINPDTGKTFCGRDSKKVLAHKIDIIDGDWYIESIDPEDLCLVCRKASKWDRTVEDLFDTEKFLVY